MYMEFFEFPNPIYGIHDPIGIKYLTRIRVRLSHLRAHKFAHNFNDTNSKFCSCMNNKAETVEHFALPIRSLVNSGRL